MTKLAASMDDIGHLGLELWARNLKEMAIIDTNVLLTGVDPVLNKRMYLHRMDADRRYNGSDHGWKDYIKNQRAVEHWIRCFHDMHTCAAPVITNGVRGEMFNAGNRTTRTIVEKWFGVADHKENSFYIGLRGKGELPTDVADCVERYTKENRYSQDASTMGTAYELSRRTGIKTTIVSDDWDFNVLVGDSLRKHGTPSGNYVHLERSASFVRRLQIPLIKKAFPSVRHAEPVYA